ncbi:hypothetical protein FA13DRAFT_1725366, partial [Coprinellus micaceus]
MASNSSSSSPSRLRLHPPQPPFCFSYSPAQIDANPPSSSRAVPNKPTPELYLLALAQFAISADTEVVRPPSSV